MTRSMKVSLPLDEIIGSTYHGEPLRLLDAIVDQAARDLIDKLSGDETYRMRERVSRIRDEAIRTAVAPLVAEAIDAAVQPTNAYGEPKGEPTTLRTLIVEEAREQLRAPLGGARSAYDKAPTLVQSLIRSEVERALRKELTDAITEAKKQVREAVEAEGAKVIAETITRLAVSR